MPIEVQVGPPQIAIHQGQTVLITGEDGQVAWPTDKGLYFLDTRLISAWAIYANGETMGSAERRGRSPITPRGSSSPMATSCRATAWCRRAASLSS